MNIFLVIWSPAGDVELAEANAELNGLLPELPQPCPNVVNTWLAPSRRAGLVWAAHSGPSVGGVRYVHRESQRFSLFTGRPFRWTGVERADGRRPLDPSFYLRPSGEWIDDLDGRCAVVRYDDRDRALEVWSDPLGAYPLFWCDRAGTISISNSVELLGRALGRPSVDLGAVATMLACGWSLRGSLVEGVARVERGAVMTWRPRRRPSVRRQLTTRKIVSMMGAGFDPELAADQLVAATSALADWPGRPSVLRLSGGRDSRLLLAAALAAGIEFEVSTDGRNGSPDLRIARWVCKAAGVELRANVPAEYEAWDRWMLETAPMLGLTAGSAISVQDASGYFDGAKNALPLIFNGQGGEIARANYGIEQVAHEGLWRRLFMSAGRSRVSELARNIFSRVAHSVDLLTARGQEAVEHSFVTFVESALAGRAQAEDVRDLFYLQQRMAGWAAIGHGCVEYVKGDNVCPLWSRQLLPQQLGAPLERRAAEYFPQAVLEVLAPRLVSIPYVEWAPIDAPTGPRSALQQQLRGFVDQHPALPLWEVLDRQRVKQLAATPPSSLDFVDDMRLCRLATAFFGVPWDR